MPVFHTVKELITVLSKGSDLLNDMFIKRKTTTISYDEALATLGGDEDRLRLLIKDDILLQTGSILEIGDAYMSFFENVLEVNEEINVASVRQYVDSLKLNINSYLSAQSEQKKMNFLKEIRHIFRSIDQATQRNVIDLKRNVDNTYKQEEEYRLKKLRLKDFDQKVSDIAELIRQTENQMNQQPIFFSNATDVLLRQTVNEVRNDLKETAHALIDIQKQIIDYLNRIEYQSKLIKKVRQLKYLKDMLIIRDSAELDNVLIPRNPVWMSGEIRFSTKVSIDFLRNDDRALEILNHVRKYLSRETVLPKQLSGRIEPEYFDMQTETMRMFNHQEMFNAFKAQGNDLFNFIKNYPFKEETTEEDRLVLFLQLASQFPDDLNFTGEYRDFRNIQYPIILP